MTTPCPPDLEAMLDAALTNADEEPLRDAAKRIANAIKRRRDLADAAIQHGVYCWLAERARAMTQKTLRLSPPPEPKKTYDPVGRHGVANVANTRIRDFLSKTWWGNKPLGLMTRDELSKAAEGRQQQARGHMRNATFLLAIRDRIGEQQRVRDALTNEQIAAIFDGTATAEAA